MRHNNGMNQVTDIDLINRILDGGVSEYAVLVERYKDMAFTIAYRIVNNREDAEEVVQDAFLKTYKSLKQFKRKSKFSTWLFRIVYNTSVSKKRLKRMPVSSFEDLNFNATVIQEDHETDSQIQEAEKASMLEKVLNALTEEERTIVTLYYLDESSIEDIHSITGLSRANVKIKLFRARKKMQHMISGNPHFVYA